MKNEKIITALNKLKSDEETKNHILNNIKQKQNNKKTISKIPLKILATAAALVLIIGLINIQTVIAFVKEMFFIPGVGFSHNDLQVAMMNEPVEITCDIGKFTLEFATKVKYGDGKCEILLYLNTKDKGFEQKLEERYKTYEDGNIDEINNTEKELSADALINGEIYELKTTGTSSRQNNGFFGNLTIVSNDFPDINEFDLLFRNTITHIVLTELSPEEKVPYTSEEKNGIKLAVYKYRNNNRLISVDVINNNDMGEFYSGTPEIHFNTVTGENETEIEVTGGNAYSFVGWVSKGYGFGYYIKELDNDSNMELTGVKVPFGIVIEYYPELVGFGLTKPQIKLPIPKDGETIRTDIKIPVGGMVYEITEVRREGNTIYYKDNGITENPEAFDMEAAIKNNEVYIIGMNPLITGGILQADRDNKSIAGFNPDDDSVEINIRSIQIVYCGDYSVDLTHK